MSLDETRQRAVMAQKGEITEYVIYEKLSRAIKNPHNKEILLHISQDELKHSDFWKEHTGNESKPNWVKVWTYYLISRIFGLTFGVKLMENGEKQAQIKYRDVAGSIPAASDIAEEEDQHENQLIQMINEERLNYIGSIVMGLNDALIELSGTLAGLSFALQNSRLVAMAGLITGIAASLSMGSTGYLTSKSEEGGKAPLKSALYTGITYIVTVLLLIFPYLIFTNVLIALAIMILNVIVVIIVFNFYISVAKDLSFWRRFSEMATVSLGIAAISFGIGVLVRNILGINL